MCTAANGYGPCRDYSHTGHGSHVAGVVGGKRYGIAHGATIHPVKVVPASGAGPPQAIARGASWVLEFMRREAGALDVGIVVMSLGTPGLKYFDEICKRLLRSGIAVVTSAGNAAGQRGGDSRVRSCLPLIDC